MSDRTTEGFALSPEQRRLWRLGGSGPPFYAQVVARIDGRAEVERLRSAVEQVASRFEILRTRFVQPANVDTPLQVIDPRGEPRFRSAELGAEAPEAAALERWAAAERRAFDLGDGPILRAAALGGAGATWLVLTLPALAADATSLVNLLREVAAAYGGEEPGPGDGVVQYADIAAALTELLDDEEAAQFRELWPRFEGRPQEVSALFERTPEAPPPEFAVHSVAASPELAAAAERAAGASTEGAEAWWLTVWQVLLCRLAGRWDRVPLGRRLANRRYEGLDEALGLFARTVAVDPLAGGEVPFSAAVERAAERIGELAEGQEFFLLEDGHWAPYLFAIERTDAVGAEGHRLRIEALRCHSDRFRLELTVRLADGAVFFDLAYDPTCFGHQRVEAIAEGLTRLAAAAAATPDAPVGRLPLLREEQRVAALRSPPAGSPIEPTGPSVIDLFERWARERPGETAVVALGVATPYGELAARVDELAARIVATVPAQRPVAIWAARTADTLAAMLACLKAGNPYLALDADAPQQRSYDQLVDSQAGLLIIDREPPSLAGLPPRRLRLDAPLEAATDSAPRRRATPPQALAYLIYTSGSTGEPKGVGVTHGALTHYCLALHRLLGLDPGQGLRFASVTSLAADLGHTAVFGALTSGGTLHLLSYEEVTEGSRFASYLAEQRIDVLKIVPSHLRALAAAAGLAPLLPARDLVLGGELFSLRLAAELAAAGAARVFNHYGPTEATVGATAFPLDRAADEMAEHWSSVPIGAPLGDAEALVLDPFLEPVPDGTPGQLFLAGPGLARGYVGKPAATASRFLPHPSPRSPGRRLYATGDRVRRHGGLLEFLGRVDRQAKIRGFRVEPGEVESRLAAHPQVAHCAVTVHTGESERPRLVAYWVASGSPAPTPGELRQFLEERIPEYLIPSVFVPLGALPLTANGKLDRAALPEPEAVRPEQDRPFVPPGTPEETLLAELWVELLGLDRVGIHDNFFVLGGDSIIGVQIAARVNQAGYRLEPVDLFRHATIGELAARLAASRTPEAAAEGSEPGVPASARLDLDEEQLADVLGRIGPAVE